MLKLYPALSILLPVFLTGCGGGGPAAPKPGTNAFYWQAANENFQNGDYQRASDQLDHILRTENDFTPRARPWRMVLAAGLMNGYRELADQYEQGARNNRTNPGFFRKYVSNYRGFASRAALLLADTYGDFEKAQPAGDLNIDFPYPGRGSVGLPPAILRVAQGQIPPDSEIPNIESAMLQRGVLRAVCLAVGAKGDPAKAQEIMKTIPAKVPRVDFEFALASAMYDGSDVFSPYKGSEPVRQRIMLDAATKALKNGPDAKDDDVKALTTKIEKDGKAVDAILKKIGR